MEESNDLEKKTLDFAEEKNSTVQVRAPDENLDEDRFITEEKISRDPVSVRFNKPKNSFTKRRRKSEEEEDDADEDKKKAKLCSGDKVLDSDEIMRLRKVSRLEYLNNRENKKVAELRDEIKDEIMVSDGVKLTEKEEIEFRYKKELYELVKKTEDDDVDEYRIPDAYDQEGFIDQKKRFDVAKQRYSERQSSTRGVTEQEAWEDHQAQKATVRFGAKDKKKVIDGYEFVFDDLTSFVEESSDVKTGRHCWD